MTPGPIRARLARRLDALERRDPDGTVAAWRWMWRALERSSSSVWRLRVRFALLVASDAALLAGWWVARAPRMVLRRSPAAAALAVALGLTVGGWWINARPYAPRIPLAHIEIDHERIRFQGQWMTLDDLRDVVDHYRINVAHVRLDPDARYGFVDAVQKALAQAQTGQIRVRFATWTDPSRPPTRR